MFDAKKPPSALCIKIFLFLCVSKHVPAFHVKLVISLGTHSVNMFQNKEILGNIAKSEKYWESLEKYHFSGTVGVPCRKLALYFAFQAA